MERSVKTAQISALPGFWPSVSSKSTVELSIKNKDQHKKESMFYNTAYPQSIGGTYSIKDSLVAGSSTKPSPVILGCPVFACFFALCSLIANCMFFRKVFPVSHFFQ